MSNEKKKFFDKVETSAVMTIIGIILLFSTSIIVILIAPTFIDPSWTTPTTPYQVQMYEIADPSIYISNSSANERQLVNHIQAGQSLLAFQESETTRIIAPPELEKYITHNGNEQLKLTSRLLLLRTPVKTDEFDGLEIANSLQKELQKKWSDSNPNAAKEGLPRPNYEIFELYIPEGSFAFSRTNTDGILENWVDSNYVILDQSDQSPSYHSDPGVIYIQNPQEYRIKRFEFNGKEGWRYDPNGEKVASLEQLRSPELGFMSRQQLIRMGEDIYAKEGCWYCHTDQTRTLIQDVVLNGSDSYPAPPSSANEYIYQRITFPGTKRNAPDISRVGIKRPSRDWHKGHFWSPKTASPGSIMPAFQHFFDNDPRGTGQRTVNLPNYQFEAIFQYLMTKGTRITPPTQAWWLGKDPIKTKEIIEGMRTIK